MPNKPKIGALTNQTALCFMDQKDLEKYFGQKKIAEIIDYQFNELKISTINDGKTDLAYFLTSIRQKAGKNVLFIENFGEISRIKSAETNAYINPAAKDIILNTMHQFSADHLVMVGATEELKGIDSEVFSPGRFDILIPVFPPNANERAQMILRYLTLNLEKDSVLTKILAFNAADKKPFWKDYASRMKIFSNTMVIDFTQSIKKRIRNKYLKVKNHEIKLDKDLLELSFLESASKLNDDYLASMKTFLIEVSSRDYDVFSSRIEALKQELIFFTKAEPRQRAIGFGHHDEKEEKPKR